MFVLLYKETLLNINDLDSSLHSVVSPLLQEFEDLFPENGPSGLRIEHQIDFTSGATIPNQLAYRTNLEGTKELQCQVEELFIKGYVRKSLSQFVVHVLPIPKNDGSWRMSIDFRVINNIMVKIRGMRE